MITPRRTRLVRVPDLHRFRHAARLLSASADVAIVPTRAAAELFRRSLEKDAAAVPALVTRSELYDTLQQRLASPGRRISPIERDALAQAAAARAAAGEPELAFHLRPGLVAEMLRFYDQLRRQSQQVSRFEELITQPLAGGADDRGAGRLLVQTRFLAAAFREYERLLDAAGVLDEHTLRGRLIAEAAVRPVRRVVVTVADWIADPDGLFGADFDLLARIPDLQTVDLIATAGMLASGLHERIHTWWPGLEEIDISDLAPAVRFERPSESAQRTPVLLSPPVGDGAAWFTFRDREEELVDVARRFRARTADRTAVVFKRPLPYLYLAPETLGAAGVPYEVFDALPLAAEPIAAAIDAVLDAVESGFTRSALVALLRSPQFRFEHGGAPIARQDVSALDHTLSGARYLGEISRLEAIAADHPHALPALHAALACARELEPLMMTSAASTQIARLIAFVDAHLSPPVPEDPLAAREERGRLAIRALLDQLAGAHARLHDPEWTISDLASGVRRWISEQTFDPEPAALDGPGVCLVDEQAARYASFDEVVVVGLVENEWPERARRSIFYGAGLLKALGWPSEKDRRGGADARFVDLLASADARTILSTFTLDDEALVTRSTQLDEVPRARLTMMPIDDQAAAEQPVASGSWLDLRAGRTSGADPAFHGQLGPRQPRPWSVSALETYIGCPFKFFAQHVLRLQEEPDDEEVMDPRRQGQFVHEVFEKFFDTWQKSGRRAISAGNLDDARKMFEEVVERLIERLPEGEAGLERTRLLGSSAAAGLGEAVFRMEAERPTAVVERLLEQKLDGGLRIRTETGERTVHIRGKADRIDLLEDGTFRLIDYKLGWPPNKARALQLPIYALSVEQRLADRAGKKWTLGEAAYLAFKGPRRVLPLFASPSERDEVMAAAQQRLADTIDAIERGEFPPAPDDVFRCETCHFTSVCRKDYVQRGTGGGQDV